MVDDSDGGVGHICQHHDSGGDAMVVDGREDCDADIHVANCDVNVGDGDGDGCDVTMRTMTRMTAAARMAMTAMTTMMPMPHSMGCVGIAVRGGAIAGHGTATGQNTATGVFVNAGSDPVSPSCMGYTGAMSKATRVNVHAGSAWVIPLARLQWNDTMCMSFCLTRLVD